MRNNICKVVRQELDELMLDETGSAAAMEHLRECASCREFYQQQTKLRQIVGSLGTVAAPADFDFRLRARLANDSSSAGLAWPFARRGFALATVLLVLATGAVLIRNVLNQPAGSNEVVTTQQPVAAPEPSKQVETKAPDVNPEKQLVATVREKRPRTVKSERVSSTAARSPRRLVAEDFSSTRAEVISVPEPAGEFDAFPLDASLQSFKVLLDDGRGNARTISVPTVTFGSQRMLQTGNQFAPKRVW